MHSYRESVPRVVEPPAQHNKTAMTLSPLSTGPQRLPPHRHHWICFRPTAPRPRRHRPAPTYLCVNPLSRIHPRLHCIVSPSSPNPLRKSRLLESSCISNPRCPLQRSSSSRWARSRAWLLARTGAVSDTAFNGAPVRIRSMSTVEMILRKEVGGARIWREDLVGGQEECGVGLREGSGIGGDFR